MEWLTDRELDTLDEFLRGNAGPGTGPAFLTTLDAIGALCRAYPRASAELRVLRAEAQRLRLHVAQESENARRLERELAVARGTIEGLERQVRAALSASLVTLLS
jgi:hypothetical protein